MSLPSIPAVICELGFTDHTDLSEAEAEKVLVAAMKRDLPLAVRYLHQKAHEVEGPAPFALWSVDPNSDLGKQLIRLHASDALRPLASKHFCHGLPLTFCNCCGGIVGVPPKNIALLQIQMQAGPIAYADC